jgi:hypothetical protein
VSRGRRSMTGRSMTSAAKCVRTSRPRMVSGLESKQQKPDKAIFPSPCRYVISAGELFVVLRRNCG